MKPTLILLLGVAALAATPAWAGDSWQGGQAWGTGTTKGNDRAAMHAVLAANAIRLKNGDNITSSNIESNGVKNVIQVTGNDNTVGGNKLNGENTDSPVSTEGQIAGGNGGAFNPFTNQTP